MFFKFIVIATIVIPLTSCKARKTEGSLAQTSPTKSLAPPAEKGSMNGKIDIEAVNALVKAAQEASQNSARIPRERYRELLHQAIFPSGNKQLRGKNCEVTKTERGMKLRTDALEEVLDFEIFVNSSLYHSDDIITEVRGYQTRLEEGILGLYVRNDGHREDDDWRDVIIVKFSTDTYAIESIEFYELDDTGNEEENQTCELTDQAPSTMSHKLNAKAVEDLVKTAKDAAQNYRRVPRERYRELLHQAFFFGGNKQLRGKNCEVTKTKRGVKLRTDALEKVLDFEIFVNSSLYHSDDIVTDVRGYQTKLEEGILGLYIRNDGNSEDDDWRDVIIVKFLPETYIIESIEFYELDDTGNEEENQICELADQVPNSKTPSHTAIKIDIKAAKDLVNTAKEASPNSAPIPRERYRDLFHRTFFMNGNTQLKGKNCEVTKTERGMEMRSYATDDVFDFEIFVNSSQYHSDDIVTEIRGYQTNLDEGVLGLYIRNDGHSEDDDWRDAVVVKFSPTHVIESMEFTEMDDTGNEEGSKVCHFLHTP